METERIALKVLRRDKKALELLADAEGESMSVVLRRLIREAARQRGLLPQEAVRETMQTAPVRKPAAEEVITC